MARAEPGSMGIWVFSLGSSFSSCLPPRALSVLSASFAAGPSASSAVGPSAFSSATERASSAAVPCALWLNEPLQDLLYSSVAPVLAIEAFGTTVLCFGCPWSYSSVSPLATDEQGRTPIEPTIRPHRYGQNLPSHRRAGLPLRVWDAQALTVNSSRRRRRLGIIRANHKIQITGPGGFYVIFWSAH